MLVTFTEDFVEENKDHWPFNHLKCTQTGFYDLDFVLIHSDHASKRIGMENTFTAFRGFSVNRVAGIPSDRRSRMLMDVVSIRIVPPHLKRLVGELFYFGQFYQCWAWQQICLGITWQLLTPRDPKLLTHFSYCQAIDLDYLLGKYLKSLAEYYISTYVTIEHRDFTWSKWRTHCQNSFWGGRK